MPPRPTPDVLSARRYAARTRIVVALVGLGLLLVDRSVDPHPVTAALGLGVILLTGVLEAATDRRGLLRLEEPFSCLAGILIVGFGAGEISAITLLWLVAAAVGVLARGGRVGNAGRVLILGTLASPLILHGPSAEAAGLALAAILMLLATGRLSRETAELLRRARYDADHDALTGALASHALRARLDEQAAAATPAAPVSLVLLDVDDFARINKRRGHVAGDAVLDGVAAAITAALSPDDVLGRVDGDTFAVLCRDADPLATAETLRGAVEGVTLSAGIAVGPHNGTDAEGLLAAADVALRVAKRSGKDRAIAYAGEPMTSASDGARQALDRLVRGEGLRMEVQPIVDLATGDVHAYEALARFDTGRGQGPLHWFSLADELGMRDELELACLRKALALLPELPRHARLSVNLSAPMLCDPRSQRVFATAGSLERLIVEVTEEALARDDGSLLESVAWLRARHATFAVDDIGAGYSGLGQVATLQPAYLKLDRSLVSGIEDDPGRASLIAAMAGYAVATGALLVAEGVETAAELRLLRSLGVPLIQGFLLGRPGVPWPKVSAPVGVAAGLVA